MRSRPPPIPHNLDIFIAGRSTAADRDGASEKHYRVCLVEGLAWLQIAVILVLPLASFGKLEFYLTSRGLWEEHVVRSLGAAAALQTSSPKGLVRGIAVGVEIRDAPAAGSFGFA